MANSKSQKARNGSVVEGFIFALLKTLQTLPSNVYTVRGNDEYREVSDPDFNIYYTKGVIKITTGTTVVCSNNQYIVEGNEDEYVSSLTANFFTKLQKLLLDYKNISANNTGFIEAQWNLFKKKQKHLLRFFILF